MNTYYLRFIASDYPQLIALGEALQIIKVVPPEKEGIPTSIYVLDGGAWDEIGNILDENNPGQYKKRGNDLLVFVNLLTPVNIKERAMSLIGQNPAIGPALANIGRFFIDDGNNNAAAPTTPYRIFFTNGES